MHFDEMQHYYCVSLLHTLLRMMILGFLQPISFEIRNGCSIYLVLYLFYYR